MVFHARSLRFNLDRQPILLGVVNVTPDSFSDGGKFIKPAEAIRQAKRLIQEGANCLDIGAESTRPGARRVSARIQCQRLVPIIRALKKNIPAAISVDTTLSEVAEACLQEGAHIINDTSGLQDDPKLASVVKQYQAGLILMHRRGTPDVMQKKARYQDVVKEVYAELKRSILMARRAGVSKNHITIDPGIGFSKKLKHNLTLLKHLDEFKKLGVPICLGTSRKSFLGQITERPVHEREWGTAATVALGIAKGVKLIRVHNVGAHHDVVQVTNAILQAKE